MADEIYDVVVIGGGINGAGIAADAAQRGLSVLLAEAGDLGGATSSASSKLIHGGLRYLEHYEFRLVREALAEREVLLGIAPHIIRPLRFVLPHVEGMRPSWMMRAGLFLYDHLATRARLGGSRPVDLRSDPAGEPLMRGLKRGFTYWDCAVDDARLVVLNALAARQAGARIETRTPVSGLLRGKDHWVVRLGTTAGREVMARAVVNASGPWVADVAQLALRGSNAPVPSVRLVKGSHIVVPRIAGANDAYTLQNDDGRVVFALPFEDDFTLIGTTETALQGDPRAVSATSDEQAYLIAAVNRYFRAPVRASDIVWSFAGVRPLEDDGSVSASAVSRDYKLELVGGEGPPLLNVIGGKITTYRKLAEAAMKLLAPLCAALAPGRTATTPLPGGDLGGPSFEDWFADFARRHAGFERTYLLPLARRYGTRAEGIIEGATSRRGLGEDFAGLSAREIAYLRAEEWARTADDILWRRTKAGLHVPADQRKVVADRLDAYLVRF